MGMSPRTVLMQNGFAPESRGSPVGEIVGE